MKKFATGPLLIMLAASLWALDPLFRSALRFQPATIVMLEHLFGFVFFALILLPHRKSLVENIKKLNKKDWLNILAMTLVSSILGSLLFTEAIAIGFKSFDFITPTLLQKTQPIFVVLFSLIFLREKISLRFLLLVPIALVGSYMIDFGTNGITLQFTDKEIIFLLSLGAAAAWGVGTILSKNVLKKLNYKEAGAIRFLFAAILTPFVAYAIRLFSNILSSTNLVDWHYDYGIKTSEFGELIKTSRIFPNLEIFGNEINLYNFVIIAIIGLITGALGIFIYYRGLRNTSAKVSTFAELTYPIIALLVALTILNPYGAPQALPLAKAFGVFILLITMILISLENNEAKRSDKN